MNRILSAHFERAASDTKARTVQAVLSTETPVNRGGVFEVLTHTSASIDLSRFPLPVIINHDSYNLPIAVAENPKITGGKLRATIRFGESEQATEIFNDVLNGIMGNLSIGYEITKSHAEIREGKDFLISDNFTPYEASIVAIPADQNAGFNRNFQQPNQDKNMTLDIEKIKNDTLTAERERINNIKLAVRAASLDDSIADKWIAGGLSADAAREQALNMMIERAQSTPTHSHGGFDYGSSNDNHLTRAIGDALLMRANIRVENPSPAARDFKHTSITEMAKIFLERSGASTVGLNQTTILQRAFTTSSDFIGVLDAIQDKALQNAYTIQASTMEAWTTVKDTDFFRDATIVNLGEMPALEQIMEGGEYTYGSVDSIAEKISMAKYGKIFSLSWEALRRDDLGAFIQLPARFGEEAKRTETTLVYKALTSNPTLSDGKAFFHASRGNLSTTPTSLSLGSLSAARSAMRKFKGLGNIQYIDAIPVTLLVPVELESAAEQLVAAISATKSADSVPNWVKSLNVVADPRLSEVSEKDWYLFCDPNAIEGFTRLHLDGNPVSVTQEEAFESDGVKFKCRLAMGVGAIDWRAAYKTIGA